MPIPENRFPARYYPLKEEYKQFQELAKLERVSASQLSERLMVKYLEENQHRLPKPAKPKQ